MSQELLTKRENNGLTVFFFLVMIVPLYQILKLPEIVFSLAGACFLSQGYENVCADARQDPLSIHVCCIKIQFELAELSRT